MDELRQACKALLAEVYVGDGKIVCPPAIAPRIKAIAEALKVEQDHSTIPTKYLKELEQFVTYEGLNDCTCACCLDMRNETRALFPDLFGEWKNDDR